MHPLTIKTRWWHNLIKKLAASSFGIWLLPKSLYRIDKLLLKLSGNRASLTSWLAGLPVILLTTTGAKSGLSHQMPLVSLQDGEKLILIASYFGSQHHPGWYYNLKANPQVAVSFKGQTISYLARQAQGEECADYWQLAVELYPGYSLYQQRAGCRQIPVIVLEPDNRSAQ
jgi:deazaflavin-dependent oxidoreductase (nitroreductase family)